MIIFDSMFQSKYVDIAFVLLFAVLIFELFLQNYFVTIYERNLKASNQNMPKQYYN